MPKKQKNSVTSSEPIKSSRKKKDPKDDGILRIDLSSSDFDSKVSPLIRMSSFISRRGMIR